MGTALTNPTDRWLTDGKRSTAHAAALLGGARAAKGESEAEERISRRGLSTVQAKQSTQLIHYYDQTSSSVQNSLVQNISEWGLCHVQPWSLQFTGTTDFAKAGVGLDSLTVKGAVPGVSVGMPGVRPSQNQQYTLGQTGPCVIGTLEKSTAEVRQGWWQGHARTFHIRLPLTFSRNRVICHFRRYMDQFVYKAKL
jgi:hypothetical protein